MNPKESQTKQKLRGGYYTPEVLAEFLVRWVGQRKPQSILEPSCGDGVFIEKIASHLEAPAVLAFEIDEEEAQKATQRASTSGLARAEIRPTDFLGWAAQAIKQPELRFDAILGNPPFIRYQYLPSNFQRQAQEIFSLLGCKFTKHTNAWVPFVMASFALLRPGGRLAMVVPTEIIHILHAQSLRTYLGENARRITIVDPEQLWFPGTLQGAVLLLAEKKRRNWRVCRGHWYPASEGTGVRQLPTQTPSLAAPWHSMASQSMANGLEPSWGIGFSLFWTDWPK